MNDRLPPLNWLRTFEAAARHLSFTLAAGELGMTQSAVSQQIRSLEEHLGEQLFVRRARSVQLTAAARHMLPHVEAGFALLGHAAGIADAGADSGQRLDIHANMAFTTLWLAPRLERFLNAHPWALLNVSTSVWTSEYVRPHASVEVRFGLGRWEGLQGRLLRREAAYPVARPGTAFSAGTRLMDAAGVSQGWRQWLRAAGHDNWRTRPVHSASTFVVTLEMARRGQVAAMAHDLLVAGDIADGRLVALDGPRLDMSEGYYLLEPHGAGRTPASRAFVSWLLEELAVA